MSITLKKRNLAALFIIISLVFMLFYAHYSIKKSEKIYRIDGKCYMTEFSKGGKLGIGTVKKIKVECPENS